ncbi:MAG: hypothetical protein JSS65_09665 [Armatimonadetes bacterium]|nr:hypothetical protein [Armatimonadota bacterium]
MLNVLVVLVSVLIALVAVGLAALSQVAKRLTQATVELDRKLGRLEQKVSAQDAAIADLRKSLDKQAADPLMEIVRVAQGWKSNGLWSTVAALGSRIIRSYWGQKRSDARSLPAPKETKK